MAGIILCIAAFTLPASNFKDSIFSTQLMVGSSTFGFNKIISSSKTNAAFFYNEVAPSRNPALGIKFNLAVTPKKNIALEILYSKASIGYHYSPPYSNNTKFNTNGHIRMQGVEINTCIQYKVFDWLKVNYGLGHYFNIANTFDSAHVGEELGWTNKNKSNMKTYALALGIGAEFKIYRRFYLQANTMRGLSNFIVLHLYSEPETNFPLKLGYTSLTLNYRIY